MNTNNENSLNARESEAQQTPQEMTAIDNQDYRKEARSETSECRNSVALVSVQRPLENEGDERPNDWMVSTSVVFVSVLIGDIFAGFLRGVPLASGGFSQIYGAMATRMLVLTHGCVIFLGKVGKGSMKRVGARKSL